MGQTIDGSPLGDKGGQCRRASASASVLVLVLAAQCVAAYAAVRAGCRLAMVVQQADTAGHESEPWSL